MVKPDCILHIVLNVLKQCKGNFLFHFIFAAATTYGADTRKAWGETLLNQNAKPDAKTTYFDQNEELPLVYLLTSNGAVALASTCATVTVEVLLVDIHTHTSPSYIYGSTI